MSNFEENIKDLDLKPNDDIVNGIDTGRFPFSQNLFFENDSITLASEEYRRCHDIFERRLKGKLKSSKFLPGTNGYREIMEIYLNVKNRISYKESRYIKELEGLAERTVREMYGINDDMELEGYIKPNEKEHDFNSSKSNGKPSELGVTDDRLEEIYMEAQKRVILNTLAHGSSIHIWKSSFYLVKDVLDKMDTDLMSLYDEYTSIVSIMLWMYSPHDMERMIMMNTAIAQGHNKVTWSDDEEEDFEESFDEDMEEEYQKFLEELKEKDDYEEEEPTPIGTSVAINFPVLLHEINKSVFEILSMKSIPTDFNEKEMAIYYSIADEYSEEVWHYFLGPTLWVNLLPVMKEAEMNLADVYDLISDLSYESLAEFCVFVMEDKDKAVNRLKLMSEVFDRDEDE